MSYDDGWAALNLEMPNRVPRTEYSADGHMELVSAVTGATVDDNSSGDAKWSARKQFYERWHFDFFWSILIHNEEYGDVRTRMGHAEYASGGADFSTDIRCPFATPEQVLAFDPFDAYGTKDHGELVKRFEEHYASQGESSNLGVTMTGVYTTCISGLIEIFGWDMLLLAAGTNPVEFGNLTNRYCTWMEQYFAAMADADVPVVMVHDDIVWSSGPFMNPEYYRSFVFPNYKRMFAPLVESGKKIVYTSDGDYTMFIDDIADCGVHAFVLEPMTDMAYIAENYGKTHAFIGNADTRILLSGTRDEIRMEVERCMRIGKHCPGFIMAVGNHIPPNTPVENALYYNEVYEKLSRR